MNIIEATVAVDLSMLSFEQAVGNMQTSPINTTLYAPYMQIVLAEKIAKQYGCGLVLIPNQLAKNYFVWGVKSNDTLYWSNISG